MSFDCDAYCKSQCQGQVVGDCYSGCRAGCPNVGPGLGAINVGDDCSNYCLKQCQGQISGWCFSNCMNTSCGAQPNPDVGPGLRAINVGDDCEDTCRYKTCIQYQDRATREYCVNNCIKSMCSNAGDNNTMSAASINRNCYRGCVKNCRGERNPDVCVMNCVTQNCQPQPMLNAAGSMINQNCVNGCRGNCKGSENMPVCVDLCVKQHCQPQPTYTTYSISNPNQLALRYGSSSSRSGTMGRPRVRNNVSTLVHTNLNTTSLHEQKPF